jgi:hypothetical protein
LSKFFVWKNICSSTWTLIHLLSKCI